MSYVDKNFAKRINKLYLKEFFFFFKKLFPPQLKEGLKEQKSFPKSCYFISNMNVSNWFLEWFFEQDHLNSLENWNHKKRTSQQGFKLCQVKCTLWTIHEFGLSTNVFSSRKHDHVTQSKSNDDLRVSVFLVDQARVYIGNGRERQAPRRSCCA